MADEELLGLYQAASKHSGYQILSKRVTALLPRQPVPGKPRYEQERLDYLCRKLDFAGLALADIGGNTGFFTFELLDRGARSVTYYEGNREHHRFVAFAAARLGLTDRLFPKNEYVDFEELDISTFDCILLLNVLHHIGDDFGDRSTQSEAVMGTILSALAALAHKTRFLVLQLGFNWKGDRASPIFPSGTKSEMISLVSRASDSFEVVAVGIAGRSGALVRYDDANEENLRRDDSLGEFLNRPLFVLRSRKR